MGSSGLCWQILPAQHSHLCRSEASNSKTSRDQHGLCDRPDSHSRWLPRSRTTACAVALLFLEMYLFDYHASIMLSFRQLFKVLLLNTKVPKILISPIIRTSELLFGITLSRSSDFGAFEQFCYHQNP